MNPKSILACLLGAALGGTPAAQAALGVTNGNFETGGGNNIDNVTEWFDRNTGNFWEAAWQTNAASITPNGTNVVLFSSFGATSDPLVGTYLYQAIGTADGASSVKIGFDLGAPNDAGAGLSEGMTVAIYAFDGIGTFVPGDNVDLHAASQTAGSGVTLLSSNSSAQFVSTGVDGQISSYQATLDLSGAGTQQLFLSFNNYLPSTTECWPILDNVVIIPDTPMFSVQPTPYYGFVGSNVTLTATAVSDPAPTFQWEYSPDGLDPWTPIDGATSASYEIVSAPYSANGYYRVVADNGTSITSDAVEVSLVYPSPVITAQPASVGVLPGADVQLSVSATGLGNLSFQWFKVDVGGDIELTGEINATLQLNNISAVNAGSYYVIVSDDAAVADEGVATETISATASVSLIDVPVTASATAPTTDSFDQFYLPGNVDDVDNIDGSPGGVPITFSDTNDASTYVAFDRTSQGMTFTTGSDPLGYTVSSITVRNVQWTNYLDSGTFYNIQNGDTFEFQFGSISGGVKTPLFDTNGAQYTGDALVNAATPNNLGSGQYLTFNLSSAGIGTLAPNTTYYFEITTETGDAFFELSGTTANGYAAGTAFRGDTMAMIDGTYVELTGDRAFHVDLTGLSGPADDFASWIAGYPGVGALTGFNDDADGDGIDNGLENLFGTDPSVSSQGIVQVAKTGNTVTFQHPQNANAASDVTAGYRWSTDLVNFHEGGASADGATVTFSPALDVPSAGTTTVTATITGTAPVKLFVTLSATRIP